MPRGRSAVPPAKRALAKRAPAKRAVTSRDVAEAAGVSQATVSLVLNGASGNIRVSGVTRERVLAAAAALGYAPNHAARSLRRRSTNVIALILPALDNPYHAEVVVAAQAAARAPGSPGWCSRAHAPRLAPPQRPRRGRGCRAPAG